MVLTTSKNHFVDIRIVKPIPLDIESTDHDASIDWIITGLEHPIEGTSKIEFKHEINSHLELNCGEAYDVGDFSDRTDGDRDETGVMTKLDTGKVEPYIEVWRSIDPLASKPAEYVRESGSNASAPCVVYKVVDNPDWLGQMVRLGNFAQGAVLNKSSNKVSCVRWFLRDGQWAVVFQNGPNVGLIPLAEDKEGTTTTLDGLTWTVIQSTF